MSSVRGNTKINPSRSLTIAMADRSDGTEVTGSGNPEMPCRRMHPATFTQCANAWAEGAGPDPGPAGRSFWHFAFAALKAGDEGSVPPPSWNPPLALGSGKFGT